MMAVFLTGATDPIAVKAAASTGLIHTASPGDESSPATDAVAGTDISFVHTGGVWVCGSGANPIVSDVEHAAASGGPVAVETTTQSRARQGEAFADALLLDQQATGAAAGSESGWAPRRSSLVSTMSASQPADPPLRVSA